MICPRGHIPIDHRIFFVPNKIVKGAFQSKRFKLVSSENFAFVAVLILLINEVFEFWMT